MRFCTKCGERIEANDKFCCACGAPIAPSKVITGASKMSEQEKRQFQKDSAVRQHFEKQFQSGYYAASEEEAKPTKRRSKFVWLMGFLIFGIVSWTGFFFISSMHGKDDTKRDISKVSVAETGVTETKAAGADSPNSAQSGSSVLKNLDTAREAFEPGLAELGFMIDDSHTSIDDTNAYYFMWDDDDTSFVISFSSLDDDFYDFQLYSCSWDQEIKMLEICEKEMGIAFEREALAGLKEQALDDSKDSEDHYGFSEDLFAGEYLCSVMVNQYYQDTSKMEYSLFIRKAYTQTASK